MDFRGSTYGLFCACRTCRPATPGEIRYVGVTVNTIEHRLKAHLNESRTSSEKAKDRWIRKHGAENIRATLLETVEGEDELRASEVNWIRELGTFGTKRGLNMTLGGDGIWGLKMSEETRARLRARTAKQMAEKHPRAKLGESDVRVIINRIWNGEAVSDIARDYPVSSSTIQRIRTGQNWPNIPRPDTPVPAPKRSHGHPRVPEEVKDAIKKEHSGVWGENKRLAAMFGLSETTISLIVNGKRG